MTEFEKALMRRDGVSADEARATKNMLREAIYEQLEEGASYDDIECLLADEAGLEMDYILDLI